MLIIIDLNIVFKGLLSLPCTFLLYKSEKFSIKGQRKIPISPHDNVSVLCGKQLR